MRTTKQLVRVSALVAGAVGFVAVTAPDSGVGRAARRLGDRLSRDIRYAVASAPGVMYRLAGRGPDPDVSDDILADRIRSNLGPLEKRLDVPHVHVIVHATSRSCTATSPARATHVRSSVPSCA